MQLTEFPEEILENIFLEVSNSGGSLIQVSETCKSFNNIIGSSAKLMERITVNWNVKKNKEVLLISKRKYRSISTDDLTESGTDQCFDPLLLCFLTKQMASIDTIEINNKNDSAGYLLSELEMLFKIVGSNLKKIILAYIRCINDKETSPFNFPKLKTIEIRGDSFDGYFNIFGSAINVEEFNFYFNGISANLTAFIMDHKFITNLKLSYCELSVLDMEMILKTLGGNLKAITLCYLSFVNNAISYPINLPKLKSIEFHGPSEDPMAVTALLAFFLDARNVEVLKYSKRLLLADLPELRQLLRRMLRNFTKLKKFSVDDHPSMFEDNFLCQETSFNLNELTLSLDVTNHLDFHRRTAYHPHIMSFFRKQNLKTLTLSRILLTEDLILCVLAMNTLKSLTIHSCCFASLPQELVANHSVQMLSIKLCRDVAASGIIFMLSNCINTRELSLEFMTITNEISTAIAEKMNSLQKLRISLCVISPPYIAYPSVTSIEIQSINEYGTFFNDVIEVVRANPQVKCLSLPFGVKFHPKYHFVMNELSLDELYWHDQEYIRETLEYQSTLVKNLDYLMFVPFLLLFMYLFQLFVVFTSSDPPDYDM